MRRLIRLDLEWRDSLARHAIDEFATWRGRSGLGSVFLEGLRGRRSDGTRGSLGAGIRIACGGRRVARIRRLTADRRLVL